MPLLSQANIAQLYHVQTPDGQPMLLKSYSHQMNTDNKVQTELGSNRKSFSQNNQDFQTTLVGDFLVPNTFSIENEINYYLLNAGNETLADIVPSTINITLTPNNISGTIDLQGNLSIPYNVIGDQIAQNIINIRTQTNQDVKIHTNYPLLKFMSANISYQFNNKKLWFSGVNKAKYQYMSRKVSGKLTTTLAPAEFYSIFPEYQKYNEMNNIEINNSKYDIGIIIFKIVFYNYVIDFNTGIHNNISVRFTPSNLIEMSIDFEYFQ